MAVTTKEIQQQPLWRPTSAFTKGSPVLNFIELVKKKRGINLNGFHELHHWSVAPETMQDFWTDAFDFFQISSEIRGPAINRTLPMFPPPRFFHGGKLNLAEQILRKGKDSDVAIHFVREGITGIEEVTWAQLRERTRLLRNAMVNYQIKPGDIVAAVISNSVDAIAICLAALSLGALWSSASSELGSQSIVERFSQSKPKIVFADDGYRYGGKLIQLGGRIKEWSQELAGRGIKGVVIVPYCGLELNINDIHHGRTMGDFVSSGKPQELTFQLLPFNHPAFVLYSSGTTGKPKCIVHSAGGVLLKVKTDSILQHDMRNTDIIFQYTTTAWIMWVLNFVNLSNAKSMMLYDGSPFFPRPGILLEMAAKIGVSIFGTSPKYLSEIRSKGIIPRRDYKLEKLRVITSTGSVLSADIYHWVYEVAFDPSILLISMSGGTDIAGSFVGGTPLLPVYPGEIQAKALGMAVDVFDASKIEATSISKKGLAGELVCTMPFPSQPLEFLGTNGADRYKKSYFERFGNSVWCQGDFIQQLKETKGFAMLGRSDGVLNPSGVRFGSAEIYAVVETFSEIEDSICVGQRRQKDSDERVLLFAKMKVGHELVADLIQRLKAAIRQKYSTRHVPKFIFAVTDIPYTVNGKKCEINVKQIVSGQSATTGGTVANPESLAQYRQYFDLPIDSDGQTRLSSRL